MGVKFMSVHDGWGRGQGWGELGGGWLEGRERGARAWRRPNKGPTPEPAACPLPPPNTPPARRRHSNRGGACRARRLTQLCTGRRS
jgi:hypothetical protein